MYKNIIINSFFSLLTIGIYAQTGINTQTPTSVLDVNGTTRIQGELLTGGDDNTPGSAGESGQFLVSQGEGQPPVWKTITVAEPEAGEYFLLGTISRIDTRGGLKILQSESTYGTAYKPEDYLRKEKTDLNWEMPSSDTWKEFDDFRLDLPAFDTEVRVVINVQTVVQAYWNPTIKGSQWISYALGVFRDGPPPYSSDTRLYTYPKGIRTGGSRGINNPSDLFTLTITIDDLPVGEPSTLRIVGVMRTISSEIRYDTSAYLVMGRDLDNATVDQSLLKRATMRVDIFQKVK